MNQWNLTHSQIQSFKLFANDYVYKWLKERITLRKQTAFSDALIESNSVILQSKALGRSHELDSLLLELEQMIEICQNLEEKENED